VIKFVSDLNISRWFSPGPRVSSTNKIYRHNITAILLKVVLNTINHKLILINGKQKIPHCRNRKRQNQYHHTRIHGRSLSCLGMGTSIESGEVWLVLWAQISAFNEMMRSCKHFLQVSKISTLTHNQANSVVIKNTIILNIIHNRVHNITENTCTAMIANVMSIFYVHRAGGRCRKIDGKLVLKCRWKVS